MTWMVELLESRVNSSQGFPHQMEGMNDSAQNHIYVLQLLMQTKTLTISYLTSVCNTRLNLRNC
jgi:hypothetical protein